MNTRTIPLTQGFEAILDAEDYDRISHLKWCVDFRPGRRLCYAKRHTARGGKDITVYMHRVI